MPRDAPGRASSGFFFEFLSPFVDPSLPPGASPIPVPTLRAYVADALALRHLLNAPTLFWLAVALALHFGAPLDLGPHSAAASAPLSWSFLRGRLWVWLFLAHGYAGFFHVALYVWGWGRRPFVAGRPYPAAKALHNICYSTVGVVLWSALENVVAYLWATGRVPFLSDAAAVGSAGGAVKFVAALALLPLWRDQHFYFAHRFLHFRPLFRFVHAVHHRCSDPEPFAGLSMHPVEHLCYFACFLPSVVPLGVVGALSPSLLAFNGVHLLLSPALAHSGFEDHREADAYHYTHHRCPDVNFSGGGHAFADVWTGAFRAVLPRRSARSRTALVADAKATLDFRSSPPTVGFVLYAVASFVCLVWWWLVTCADAFPLAASAAAWLPSLPPLFVAAIGGAGPLVLAVLFSLWTDRGDLRGLVAPFGSRRPCFETAIHVVGGLLCTVFPLVLLLFQALVVVPDGS